ARPRDSRSPTLRATSSQRPALHRVVITPITRAAAVDGRSSTAKAEVNASVGNHHSTATRITSPTRPRSLLKVLVEQRRAAPQDPRGAPLQSTHPRCGRPCAAPRSRGREDRGPVPWRPPPNRATRPWLGRGGSVLTATGLGSCGPCGHGRGRYWQGTRPHRGRDDLRDAGGCRRPSRTPCPKDRPAPARPGPRRSGRTTPDNPPS